MFEAAGLMVFYENMLALNNVSLQCGENKIVGVFGANSAGKSTLMYTLSGIILDIRKKEEMAGGERITIRGRIVYEGKDIMSDKPSLRARSGIVLCPERRRIFPESTVLENLRIGSYLATTAQASETLDYVSGDISCFEENSKTSRWIYKRRRTADARYWQGFDGPAEALAARRTAFRVEPCDSISTGKSN